jgi:DNA-binding Lrp family transcriptional regulator
VEGQNGSAPKIVRSPARVVLDDVDRSILRSLSLDARMPNNVIAQKAGIAPSTCLARVRRLRETGVIRGFRADLAPGALGLPLQALVSVRLQAHARAAIGTFTERFSSLPGVLNVFFLGGSVDFMIHVAAATPDDLRNFVVSNLSASREGCIHRNEPDLRARGQRGRNRVAQSGLRRNPSYDA